jgi:hypothetical protein
VCFLIPSLEGFADLFFQRLTFKDVKAHAISFLLELEKLGKINRNDGFQGILNAIAGDVRSKHRKRLQRQNEMESMENALRHLAERKKYFEEQINSYHDYVESAMNTMQRGKGCALSIIGPTAFSDPQLGKNVLFFLSRSNTSIFASCKSRVNLPNSDPSNIRQNIYTTGKFCYQ